MVTKKKEVKEKVGTKPKFVVTTEILKEIAWLASNCLTQQDMYEYFGISHETWYKNVKKYPEIRDLIKKGRAKTKTFVVSKFMEQVKKGNLTAMIFYLKTQHRWSEINPSPIENEFKDEDKALDANPLDNIIDPIEASRVYQKLMQGSSNNERNNSSK